MSDRILITTQDKAGTEIVIKSADILGYSPVLPVFMTHQVELMNAGYANRVFIATNRSKAVYAEVNGTIVGEIVYDVKEEAIKFAYIIAGTVVPTYRGRGIYKILHQQLEVVAKSLGCSKIRSEVHPDNKPMVATLESLGKRVTYYKVEKDI
jgi:ribosomal protein S18 acetylase RimI-like enzyme